MSLENGSLPDDFNWEQWKPTDIYEIVHSNRDRAKKIAYLERMIEIFRQLLENPNVKPGNISALQQALELHLDTLQSIQQDYIPDVSEN